MSGQESKASVRQELRKVKELRSQLKDIRVENLLHKEDVLNREAELEAVTNALQKNVGLLEELCCNLEKENESLKRQIRGRKMAMERVRSYEAALKARGVDIEKALKGQEDKTSEYLTTVPRDHIVAQISVTFDYFQGCDSNEEFLRRCRILKTELDSLQKRLGPGGNGKTKKWEELKRDLAIVSQSNAMERTDRSVQKRLLEAERQRLRQRMRDLLTERR